MSFDPGAFGPTVAELLQESRTMPLGPGVPNESVRPKLERLRGTDLFDTTVRNREMANACLAGLWLHHDFLEESHIISQGIGSATGSYWHGVMHRREPDYGNSKYWFRRVGRHPIFEDLRAAAARLAAQTVLPQAEYLTTQTEWEPFDFVDLCETACGRDDALERLCEAIQAREWELLFAYCYEQALSGR